MEVRLWHEFARYVSLIAAKTAEVTHLFELSPNEKLGGSGVANREDIRRSDC